MANIKLTDIDNLLLDAINAAGSRTTLTKVKDEMVEQIKKRTRLGKGVNKPEGNTTNLKALEPKTKANRRRLRRKGELTGPGATPAKSAVNRTGQMLESLNGKVSTNEIEFKLDREGERKATDLQRIDPNGFKFMNLSKGEVQQVVDIIEKAINDSIK